MTTVLVAALLGACGGSGPDRGVAATGTPTASSPSPDSSESAAEAIASHGATASSTPTGVAPGSGPALAISVDAPRGPWLTKVRRVGVAVRNEASTTFRGRLGIDNVVPPAAGPSDLLVTTGTTDDTERSRRLPAGRSVELESLRIPPGSTVRSSVAVYSGSACGEDGTPTAFRFTAGGAESPVVRRTTRCLDVEPVAPATGCHFDRHQDCEVRVRLTNPTAERYTSWRLHVCRVPGSVDFGAGADTPAPGRTDCALGDTVTVGPFGSLEIALGFRSRELLDTGAWSAEARRCARAEVQWDVGWSEKVLVPWFDGQARLPSGDDDC